MARADDQEIRAVFFGVAVEPYGHGGSARMGDLGISTDRLPFVLQQSLGLFSGRGIEFMYDDGGRFQMDVDQREPSLGI